MTIRHARSVALCVCAGLFLHSHVAGAQDLSRYRDVPFGSSVSSVLTITGTNAAGVKIVHQQPALIQELAWRPQYSSNRPVERIEAVREVMFRGDDASRIAFREGRHRPAGGLRNATTR